nr:MAG TPA: hypothetical protein [Caudoviricetes sp.]
MSRQSRLNQFLISKGLVTVPAPRKRVQNKAKCLNPSRLDSLLLSYIG